MKNIITIFYVLIITILINSCSSNVKNIEISKKYKSPKELNPINPKSRKISQLNKKLNKIETEIQTLTAKMFNISDTLGNNHIEVITINEKLKYLHKIRQSIIKQIKFWMQTNKKLKRWAKLNYLSTQSKL